MMELLNNNFLKSENHISETLPDEKTTCVDDRMVYLSLEIKFCSLEIIKIARSNQFNIQYDDDDTEVLNLQNEEWKLDENILSGNNINVLSSLSSSEAQSIQNIMEGLSKKPFLLHHGQRYEQYPLINAHKREEDDFVKTIKRVEKSSVPVCGSIIGSHTLYKIKGNDDEK